MCLCSFDVDNLHLGGPELCYGSFPSNITFDDKGSPIVKLTLCGAPAPKVEWKFSNQKVKVLSEKINSFTHNFTLALPQPTKIAGG